MNKNEQQWLLITSIGVLLTTVTQLNVAMASGMPGVF